MGDTKDGSSIAAHRAQKDFDTPTSLAGIWEKLFGHKPTDTYENDNATLATADSVRGADDMLLNIKNMHDKRVDDVAIPTADIASISADATLDEVVSIFKESTYSRLPEIGRAHV